MAGRPKLSPETRQVNFLVTVEDYRALKDMVRAEGRPCSMGDLLRGMLQRQIESSKKERLRPSEDRG